ncbi:MAG: hypothetical protein ACTSWR_11230 [Candidatus Helarchaeota archaeon]
MVELEKILSRLVKIFNSINIKYVIVGGIAIIHYGHLRTTQDIDLILEDNKKYFPKLLGLFKKNNFDVNDADFYRAYQEKTHITIFDNKSYYRLDIKIASKNIDYDVLNNAIKEQIFNFNLNFAPLEYVLIGKLLYIGNIDDIPDSELLEYQDILDFLVLYHANRNRINDDFLMKKVVEINLGPTLKRLISFKF